MLTRRLFLKSGGVALLTLGVGGGPGFITRAALAAAGTGSTPSRRRKVLVTIFQRGAMDGLAAVPPIDAPALKTLRPRLAASGARSEGDGTLLDLQTGFGLHPAFEPLLPLWKDKRLAIVHAVGSPDPTRSHFDAQDFMETGTPGRKGTPNGWLNRAVGLLGHDASPFRAVALTPALPRSLYGDEPALAVTSLADFKVQLPGADRTAAAAGHGFEALYDTTSQDLLRDTGSETFKAIHRLSAAEIERYLPAAGAEYPRTPLGNALRQIAILIKSGVGLEVAFAESGGWDTHVQQALAFSRQARDLAQSIRAFWTDLGPYQDQVLLTTMTEFGRTVRENGSGGTDHGHGSCLFVLGNKVDGGKVHGTFPGLEPGALYEGRDLPVTTDFRAVFCELAGKHLGIKDDGKLFPGWTGGRVALVTSP
ncbi:MAG TPA: DUF1501 domain-containing protein [Thermoanaerobaculia bacterium]|jgi:uncharacterized protein (DUF1501 family)|nr:DUF1501 domain-containing protein [Thermoanaerobaculia bacterium]